MKFFYFYTDPLNILLTLSLATFVAFWFNFKKLSISLISLSIMTFILIGYVPISEYFVSILQRAIFLLRVFDNIPLVIIPTCPLPI